LLSPSPNSYLTLPAPLPISPHTLPRRCLQVFMYPEGSIFTDLELSAAFDIQLHDSVRPSAAGLLRLRVVKPQNLIPSLQNANPLGPILAVKAFCEEQLAAAAALSTESAACAAAVAALIPAASTQQQVVNGTSDVPADVCTGGCVPRVRATLGAGLAMCARQWATMPVLQGHLKLDGGTVPLVLNLNTSWVLQVHPSTLTIPSH
jgi:hypothetical protein